MIEAESIESRTKALADSDWGGYLGVLLASACWGSSGVFIKFLVADSGVSALALAFWRDLFTFTVLLATLLLFRPSWLRVRRADLVWLFALGACLGILHVFWNLGVLVNGAAVATVQQAAAPAIVAIAAWLIWHELLGWNKVLAIVLTFAGTVLVSGLDVLGRFNLSANGVLIGLGIPIMYSCWMLLGKKVRAGYNALTIMTFGFGFSSMVLLPMQAFTPQPWPVKASSWLWFAGLIAIPTVAGFLLYTYALGQLPVSVSTILAMSEIAFVSVYAYILLDERLTASQVIGTVLVVTGVVLLSWTRQRKKKDAPALNPQTSA